MKIQNLRIRIKVQHPPDLPVVLVAALMLVILLLVMELNTIITRAQSTDKGALDIPTSFSTVISRSMRQYYLTTDYYYGYEADGSDENGVGVCAAGYHFASLWEIIDPSNLRYNVNQGQHQGDSGMGPPTDIPGWVRTGYGPDAGVTPGQANCGVWDSTSGNGTRVALPGDWSSASLQDVHVWDASVDACSNDQQVWCVADESDSPGTCAQPLPLYCGQQVSGDTTSKPSHIYEYSCSPWNESGPEMIYALSLPQGDTYDVTFTLSNMGDNDLDLFLMNAGDCYTGACTAYHNNTLALANLSPGTYYLAVDGYDGDPTDDVYGDAGPYTLDVTCSRTFVYLPLILKQ